MRAPYIAIVFLVPKSISIDVAGAKSIKFRYNIRARSFEFWNAETVAFLERIDVETAVETISHQHFPGGGGERIALSLPLSLLHSLSLSSYREKKLSTTGLNNEWQNSSILDVLAKREMIPRIAQIGLSQRKYSQHLLGRYQSSRVKEGLCARARVRMCVCVFFFRVSFTPPRETTISFASCVRIRQAASRYKVTVSTKEQCVSLGSLIIVFYVICVCVCVCE